MSSEWAKIVKRVNPKPIKISDEIEKQSKQGVIVYFSIFRRLKTKKNWTIILSWNTDNTDWADDHRSIY